VIRKVAIAVGVVGLLLVGILAMSSDATDRRVDSPLIGEPVPALSGTTLDDETYDIDASRGRWTLVNFFASWCVPCVVEHPELVAFSESRSDVQVVSVPFDDRRAEVADFFEERGGDWPVLIAGVDGVALDFGVIAVPESYLVNPNGLVVAKIEGGVTEEGLLGILGELETP